MTTPADALEVMTVVAACHHRTAPRMDDRQAAIATARIWSDLFNVHNLELADLIAAVKKRAAGGHSDAPEPAEIITFAREIRRDRTERIGPTPEYQALCESKGEPPEAVAARRRDALMAAAAKIGNTHDVDTPVTFAAAPRALKAESDATRAAKVARARAGWRPPPGWNPTGEESR